MGESSCSRFNGYFKTECTVRPPVSNTFEDYVNDALISENTLISKENSNALLNIDEFYRFPWKKAVYDDKFLLNEAGNIEASIPEICQDAFSSMEMPAWILENNRFSDIGTISEEESIFYEKDIEVLKQNTLDGIYQLLDVPYIPCTLSDPAFKLPSVTDILKKLPMMEVDETFDDFDFSYEVADAFFKENLDDEIKNVPEINIENSFEEITLPELPDEEISYLEIDNTGHSNETMSKLKECKGEVVSESSANITSYESENYSEVCSVVCVDDQVHSRKTILNNKEESHYEKLTNVNFIGHSNDNSTLSSISMNENVTQNIDNDTFDDLEINVISNKSLQDIRNNEFIDTKRLTIDPVKNYFSENQQCNNDNKIEEIMSKITAESSNYKGYSFENNFYGFIVDNGKSQVDNSSEKTDLLMEPTTNFEEQFSELYHEEDNELQSERKIVVDSKKENMFLEKISNLKFEKRINLNDDCQMSSFLPYSENPKIFKTCTAIRGDNSLNSSFSSTSNENHKEIGVLPSQNLSSSQPVSLLSNFLNITKLANRNPMATPTFKISSSPKDYTKHSNEMLKILLLYEDCAVPLLQSLLLSELFKFPPKFTIVDISSCKTCFLLNQEVKRCRDGNIDLLKDGGQKKNYYSQLLTFHGLLKSLECLIEFDLQLAMSCLIDFGKCHHTVLRGYYETLIGKFDSEMNNITESNHRHPKVKEMCKFLKEKLNFCKETGLILKVLIIINKHLNIIYKAFEMALKEEECNIKTFLIPESVFLHERTLMFKSSEDTIYFVRPFSLSKNIPWKDLILVIEYEYDSNSNWKQICSENNISHAFVQVVDLPLKTLEEIQKLNTAGMFDIQPLKENKTSLIISAFVTAQYQLLYLLESKLNITICIRQYKEILPHLHFADIVMNEKSALILILHAHSIEHTSDLIKNVFSNSMIGYGLNISIPNHITKCFYSTIHKNYATAHDSSDENLETTPDSDHEGNIKHNIDFELKPNYPESFNFTVDFEDSEENLDQDIYVNSENFSYETKTNLQHVWTNEYDINKYSPEKSLQELDLDYMSLKLSDEFDGYSSYLSDDDDGTININESKAYSTKCSIVSQESYNTQENDYSYTFESLNSKLPQYIPHVSARNAQKKDNFHPSFKELDDRLELLTNSNVTTTGREAISSSDSRKKRILDFNQYMYTPRKRKFISEDPVQNNDGKLSPILKQSCKIQKGRVSKTVSKQDLEYNSPFSSQETASCPKRMVKQAKVTPFLKRDDCYGGFTDRRTKQPAIQEDVDTFFKHQLFQWSDSSLPLKNSFPMTPLSTRKLSYEKVPGVKGQTRLVFQ
ncbi:uncharacterized protein TNIN_491461 [Trichonephila inaurata madagascariensis]|uniref:Uncharacterized protein n=1 Tax=Trichonephila inaurata madagascariensis TaxID=2747483 RepID=A0A8X7BYG3_9ARAC|nr:uncharacterized protein TNIN_491461 [Trichonephila inaurata madagascariensis]